MLASTLTGLKRVEHSYMCANMNNEKMKMMLRKKKKEKIRTEMKRCEWAEDESERTGRKWNEDARWRLKRDFPVGYPVPTTCEICSEHPVAFNHQSSEATRKLMPKYKGRNGERERKISGKRRRNTFVTFHSSILLCVAYLKYFWVPWKMLI